MKRPLGVGDLVRVYDAASWPMPVVGEIFQDTSTTCDVRLDKGGNWSGFKKQCRRLRRKAPKEEKGRVERWLRIHVDGEYLEKDRNEAEIIRRLTPHHCQRVVRLLEIREGERVLSRAELERAFDKIGLEKRSDHDNQRHDKCVAYVPESSLREAEEKGRREAYEAELPALKDWLAAYHTDLFSEHKAPFTKPDCAAAAMGRHILGILVKEFEAKAARPAEEGK